MGHLLAYHASEAHIHCKNHGFINCLISPIRLTNELSHGKRERKAKQNGSRHCRLQRGAPAGIFPMGHLLAHSASEAHIHCENHGFIILIFDMNYANTRAESAPDWTEIRTVRQIKPKKGEAKRQPTLSALPARGESQCDICFVML